MKRNSWRALRDRRFAGFKFRRQYTTGEYILDFYCAAAKLAIELDGFQHGVPRNFQRDKTRQRFLAEQGIETLRFWNHQWRENREGCLLEIWNHVRQRTGCMQIHKDTERQRFMAPDLKALKNEPLILTFSPFSGEKGKRTALGFPYAIQARSRIFFVCSAPIGMYRLNPN